jgi:hypothetical protein
MKDACTPSNVLGRMLGFRETDGLPVTMEHLSAIDDSGKAHFNDVVNQWGSEVFDDALPKASDNAALKAANWLSGDSKHIAKKTLQDFRNPSGLFGEEMIKPVTDFITEHHQMHFDDIASGRQDYLDEIGNVFDDIDTSGLGPTLQDAWNKYRNFYEEGGELYTLNQRSGLEQGMSNLAGNVIKSNPTVILGNVLEGAIKLPTLYPKTFLQAIAEAQKNGGLFKEIPELAEKGVYGINYAGEEKDAWRGLIGLTDTPLKNIAYYAGELADGNGTRAVQKVAFTPRFGDLPPIYYGTGGRAAVQFLGYTINTYKMYASLFQEAKKGNIAPLVTYHALASLMGGGAAAGIPMLGEGLIESVFPDSKDWFEQNKGPLAKLVQPGNINKIGIGYDIANRQIRGGMKNWGSAMENFQSGETVNGIMDLADVGLNALTFSSSPVGDLNVQKALRIAKDVAKGELDASDIPGEVQEKYLPFTKAE